MELKPCLFCGALMKPRPAESRRQYSFRAYCSLSCARQATLRGLRKPQHMVQHELTGRCECGTSAAHVRYVKMLNSSGVEIVGVLELCDACLVLADDATEEPPTLSKGVCHGWTTEWREIMPYPQQANVRLSIHGKRLT